MHSNCVLVQSSSSRIKAEKRNQSSMSGSSYISVDHKSNLNQGTKFYLKIKP